jgi:predicted nucleic acid-binding protein
MPAKVYWDSCLFIEILERKKPDRLDACDALHELAKKGDLIIVASTIALVEVNKFDQPSALPENQSKQILDFFENPYIHLRQLDRPTAELSHTLTRTHGLMPGDAIHVATALLAQVDVLYTYDSKKNRRKGLLRHHLKLGAPPLRIEVPPKPTPGPLFDTVSDEGE